VAAAVSVFSISPVDNICSCHLAKQSILQSWLLAIARLTLVLQGLIYVQLAS